MKRKAINYKWKFLLLTLCVTLVLGMMPVIKIEAAYNQELAEDIYKATKLLESVLQDQYTALENELKEIIMDNNYNYTLTMESFYQKGNPYKNLDYLSLIATYSSIKNYCNTYGIAIGEGIAGAKFLNLTLEEKVIEEVTPVLVEKYTEISPGVFQREGNMIIRETTVLDTYEPLEDNLWKKSGSQKIEPKVNTIIYAQATVTCRAEEALYEVYGLTKEDLQKETKLRIEKLHDQTSQEALNQSVFIQTPQSLSVLSEDIYSKINQLVEPLTGTQKILVETALSLVGRVPYQWGGKPSGPGYDTSWWLFDEKGEQKGLDCSGFVEWTYMTAGFSDEIVELAKNSWNLAAIPDIPYEELEPGDIGILNHNENGEVNHLGIYLGEGYFIHCASGAGTVTVSQFPFTYFKKVQDLEKNIDSTRKYNYDKFNNYTNSEYNNKIYYENETEQIDNTDVYLLAQLIIHEAGNQGYNGMVAVAEVVKNRKESDKFKEKTIREVIYAPDQFSYVERISSIIPNEEALSIAEMVISGELTLFNNKDVLYFRNPKITNGISPNIPVNWGKKVWYTAVNDHAFYLG